MTDRLVQDQLSEAQYRLLQLQEELAQTNRGLVALTMEMEQRVEERTEELRAAHAELKNTNSDLMQLTLDLEDRVSSRTSELQAAVETLRKSRLGALNLMEDAVVARTEGERVNAAMQAEIEQRKRAEEDLRQLNLELEQRVHDRTAQLEAANRELEAFSYSVSHDLRAPLRSIDGFSQALLEDYHDKLDERGKSHLLRVRNAAQRMGQLIDEVLDLSRIQRAELSRVAIDLTTMAKEIIEDLRRQQTRSHVKVMIEPGMSAVGDPQLLRTFFQNLLENAWKFTSRHDKANIEVGSRECDGKRVFFVKDDGAGFDMAHADMLFAPFQRLHAQTEFPGTGVGLASAQRIIHRHGGTIWAEGEVEKGATFHFTL